MATKVSTVFLSYSRDDSDFAIRIAEDLKAAGASVWTDRLNIKGGELWDVAAQEALTSCPRMLAILSPDSISSRNVMDEVSFALEQHKTVIPVLYRDCTIPFRLRHLQYVDFRKDYARGLKDLVKALLTGEPQVEANGTVTANKKVRIAIEQVDALQFEGDVLLLKYAQGLHGVDRVVYGRLKQSQVDSKLPAIGKFMLQGTAGVLAVDSVLFVGVKPLAEFGYAEIRAFACDALAWLGENAFETGLVGLTLHGPGYGLDEAEAFRAELAGLMDAVTAGKCPGALQQISFVEGNVGRAERLKGLLENLLPDGLLVAGGQRSQGSLQTRAVASLQDVGLASAGKPHVFVAMPFAESMEDTFHYGIQGAVNAAGMLCERADLSTFTGDVMAWVRDRIASSKLLVADLTGANPNVYLEVGYAWGCKIPTVLLVKDSAELKFDVAGHRCLVYKSIAQLEESLKRELKVLSGRPD